MSGELRSEVLRVFKKLHRTRLSTFKGDERALNIIRQKINEEYKKHKNVANRDTILELNKFAEEVDHEIRTTVIQAVEKAPNTFELQVKKEHLVDNVVPPGTPLPKPGRRCGDLKSKT